MTDVSSHTATTVDFPLAIIMLIALLLTLATLSHCLAVQPDEASLRPHIAPYREHRTSAGVLRIYDNPIFRQNSNKKSKQKKEIEQPFSSRFTDNYINGKEDTSQIMSIKPPGGVLGRKRKSEEEKVTQVGMIAAQERREAVQDAWHANKLGVHYEPHDLAEKIHHLKVKGVPRDAIGQHSASIVKERKPGLFHALYLAHKRKLSLKVSDAKRYQSDRKILDAQRTARRQRNALKERLQRISELEEVKGIDFAWSIPKLESMTRNVDLPLASEKACSRTISWYIQHKRGREAKDDFKKLRDSYYQRKYRGGTEGAGPGRPSKRQRTQD